MARYCSWKLYIRSLWRSQQNTKRRCSALIHNDTIHGRSMIGWDRWRINVCSLQHGWLRITVSSEKMVRPSLSDPIRGSGSRYDYIWRRKSEFCAWLFLAPAFAHCYSPMSTRAQAWYNIISSWRRIFCVHSRNTSWQAVTSTIHIGNVADLVSILSYSHKGESHLIKVLASC